MFSRHDLAWLTPRGWERACAGAPAGACEAIASWGRAGWPAVVTRAHADPGPGRVALGIALPPRPADGSKPRIALSSAVGDIGRTCPALALADAIEAAPSGWQKALAALDEEAADAGLDLRVYGSLAFQALTGQAYVTATSDIDLLLHPAAAPDYRHALALLARHARILPLDGEIVCGGGQAVAWKELAAAQHGQARVLAKSLQGIALVTVDSLLASLDEDVPCSA
jgi:phosphoribosyl-dephospho-CoA transferase